MGLRRFVARLLGGDESRGDDAPPVPKTTALITRSFKATVADEITIQRGSIVRAMYREDDWIYIEASDGRRGFVPAQYCAIRRRTEPQRVVSSVRSTASADWSKSNLQRFLDSLPVKKDDGSPFHLTRLGMATMIFPYQASTLGDISLAANEKVLVLNADDPHWLFVEDDRRVRGFVPAAFVEWDTGRPKSRNSDRLGRRFSHNFFDRFIDQSLLVADDYKARSPLDMSVRAGEWVFGVYDEVRVNTFNYCFQEEPYVWARNGANEGFVPTRCVVLATNL